VRASSGLVLAVLALLQGCATTRAAPSPWPLHEHPGEFRAVLAATGEGGSELFVLEARALLRVAWADGWTLESVDLRPRGVDWYGGTAADLDGDGDDELVLWGVRPQFVSVVLARTDDGAYAPVGPPLPLLLRAVRRDAEVLLCGQRGGTERAFSGPIRRFTLTDGGVQRADELAELEGVDVLDFVFGPTLDHDGPVLYTWGEDGELERRERGAVVWHGPDLAVSRPLGREREVQPLLGSRETVVETWPVPPVVVDLDGDGVDEVLVAASDASPVQVLERLRAFRGGRYERLVPAGRGLQRQAESILVGRFTTGLAVADPDGDGADEVVMAIVLLRRSGVGRGRSALVVLDPLTGDPDPVFHPPYGGSGGESPPADADQDDGGQPDQQ